MKQQTSLEFLLTYSWALLILALFMAMVAVISFSHPVQSYLPSQCSIAPLLPCLDSLFYANTLTLLFQNNLGQALYFPANAFNVLITNAGFSGTNYNQGGCAPSLVPVGGEAVCNAVITGGATIPTGSQFLSTFIVTYELCSGGTSATCNAPTYRTTGSSLQSVGASGTGFYTINFQVNSLTTAGTIVLNGVSYPNNDIALFPSGNYVIFAQPALGHSFFFWAASGSTVASTSAQNTVLILAANTVLTGTFT